MSLMESHAWQILVVALAGWLNRQQQQVIEYLQEKNRVLREHLKGKRIRFTDDQRRRLAAKGKSLGRRVLTGIETLVTPETILRWYRQRMAKTYDGSGKRGVGRPGRRSGIVWSEWPGRTSRGGTVESKARCGIWGTRSVGQR